MSSRGERRSQRRALRNRSSFSQSQAAHHLGRCGYDLRSRRKVFPESDLDYDPGTAVAAAGLWFGGHGDNDYGFFAIFNDAGLSTATVQREGITHAQVSDLFWTNLALGGAVSLLLAFLSPTIAWFYREPRLVGITLALCVTFLLSSSAVQHLALLKRQMRFKLIAAVQLWSTAAGVLAGIVMAWQGSGYWSLVGMQVTTPLVALALAWSFSGWRPQGPRRSDGTGSLLHFRAHLTVSSFMWSLASGSDGLLIGRIYGSVSLGVYSRAAA